MHCTLRGSHDCVLMLYVCGGSFLLFLFVSVHFICIMTTAHEEPSDQNGSADDEEILSKEDMLHAWYTYLYHSVPYLKHEIMEVQTRKSNKHRVRKTCCMVYLNSIGAI